MDGLPQLLATICNSERFAITCRPVSGVDIMSAVSASRFSAAPDVLVLGEASVGFVGTIRSVGAPPGDTGLPPAEHERRLIELGFVEGAPVEILHQGLIGGDPIAVRVNETTIALRRRDAAGILVEPAGGG